MQAVVALQNDLDTACFVRGDVSVADTHHPDARRLATLEAPRVGGAHCHSADSAQRWRPWHVLGTRAVTWIEDARVPTLRQGLTGLERQHGRPVVAGVRHDLLHTDDVLDRGGGKDRGLRLLVVIECTPVVVRRLGVYILPDGVDLQVGQLLAQHGHVLVDHSPRDPPAIDVHAPGLAVVPSAANRIPRHAGTLGPGSPTRGSSGCRSNPNLRLGPCRVPAMQLDATVISCGRWRPRWP